MWSLPPLIAIFVSTVKFGLVDFLVCPFFGELYFREVLWLEAYFKALPLDTDIVAGFEFLAVEPLSDFPFFGLIGDW